MKIKLNLGKIPNSILKPFLNKINEANIDKDVIIGPKCGQDVAVLDLGDRYLVTKSDPITFATDEIGYYSVNINTNDIVTSGATPRWFQAVILLPENDNNDQLAKKIMNEILMECKEKNISLIGGHTEITYGIDRPIVIGSMIGEIKDKTRLITTMGGKPGDALFLTKGIVLEGSSIIAMEKEEELLKLGIDKKIIELGKSRLHNPGISIMQEALLLAHSNFDIHCMHDPTEGGLANGVVEMAKNSGCGCIIDYQQIPFLEGSKELCKAFNLDPLQTITSGCLVFSAPKEQSEDIIKLLTKEGILTKEIGELTENPDEFNLKNPHGNGIIRKLKYSEIDEITKIF